MSWRHLVILGLLAPASLALAEPPGNGSSEWGAFALLGQAVQPGEERRLSLSVSEEFAGTSLSTPVMVVRGMAPQRTVCLTAGIHGDELNGVEIVRRVVEEVDPELLRGTLVAIPIVNLHGFRRSSRYLPDRRDLNRFFPGHPRGSSASRIAYAVFQGVIRWCDALIDFHTGSFHRTNVPQVRADLTQPDVFDLARHFGGAVVVHNTGTEGTLRRAATSSGIPAITYEAGQPMRFYRKEVEEGIRGIFNLLRAIGMVDGRHERNGSQDVYYRSLWVRADDGGILLSQVKLGDRVRKGDLLGTVTDPLSNDKTLIHSPYRGRLIGKAVDQVVLPGFAAYHIGIEIGDAQAGGPLPRTNGTRDSPDQEPADTAPQENEERPE